MSGITVLATGKPHDNVISVETQVAGFEARACVSFYANID